MEAGKGKRTACYCRVSTDEQAKHGYSIGAQHDALEQYCKANKLDCVGFYTDEGISARKSYKKRPALLRLLKDVEQDKIDLIIFIKLDRWFRNVAAYYQVQPILEAHGVAWAATQEDYETVTASGRFKVNIMLSVAQDESDRTSERVRFIFDAKKAKGESLGGRIPIGFKLDGKRIVIDPETAPIAKDMFQSFLELRSVSKTQKMLQEKYGVKRTVRGVNTALHSGTYVEYGLIDPDLFAKVQEASKSRAPKYTSDAAHKRNIIYLFSGLAYCGACGKRMRATTIKGVIYYSCPNCRKYYQEKPIEKYLMDNINKTLQDYNVNITAEMEKRNEAKSCLPDLEKQKQKLLDLYMNDLIDRDTYQKRFEAIEQEIEKAKGSSTVERKTLDTDEIIKVTEIYPLLSRQTQKEFFNTFFKSITIYGRESYSAELL